VSHAPRLHEQVRTDAAALDRRTSSLHVGPAIGSLHRMCAACSSRLDEEAAACPSCSRKALARQTAGPPGPSHVPSIVGEVLRAPGEPLAAAARAHFESRFGHDFGRVRIHRDARAAASAEAVAAQAYAVGTDLVFGAGRFDSATPSGRRLLAHELAHVVQDGDGAHGVPDRIVAADDPSERAAAALADQALRREAAAWPTGALRAADAGPGAPRSPWVRRHALHRQPQPKRKPVQSDYETLVAQKKWCRDSAESGKLHPGLQCYREVPSTGGYPGGQQVCFKLDTGQYAEESPDYISAVSGQKPDGTCDIPMGIKDPPLPTSRRGRRALGHLIADIATEDTDLVGLGAGAAFGITMGIGLPGDGAFADLAVPAILGAMGGYLGTKGLPLLSRLTRRHGFLPTISLGGSLFGASVGIGFEKRDRPLPKIPINSYLTLGVDSSLTHESGAGAGSAFLARVGVRVDPGKQGGLFALGSVGAGIASDRNVSGAFSTQLGAGYRATDFLDVQIVRETVDERAATYWLTLKLVAPQRALKPH
jgi:hypothetical protein